MTVNTGGASQEMIEDQDKRIEELEGAVKYYRKRYRAECDVHDNLKIEAGKLEAQVAALEAVVMRLGDEKPIVNRGVSYICYDALELKARIEYARAALAERNE